MSFQNEVASTDRCGDGQATCIANGHWEWLAKARSYRQNCFLLLPIINDIENKLALSENLKHTLKGCTKL